MDNSAREARQGGVLESRSSRTERVLNKSRAWSFFCEWESRNIRDNHQEQLGMKQSSARCAPGVFLCILEPQNSTKLLEEIKQPGARSAPGKVPGYLESKGSKTIGNVAFRHAKSAGGGGWCIFGSESSKNQRKICNLAHEARLGNNRTHRNCNNPSRVAR